MAAVELVLRELLRRDLHVLFLAARVGESKVDELDLLVLQHLEYVGGCSHAGLLYVRDNARMKKQRTMTQGCLPGYFAGSSAENMHRSNESLEGRVRDIYAALISG